MTRIVVFLVVICALIPLKIVNNPISLTSLKLRQLGNAPDERAMLFIRAHMNQGSSVGAYGPSIVWGAKMFYVPIVKSMSADLYSEQNLSAWIEHNKLEGIYVDKMLRAAEPLMWALIERQIGEGLETAFADDNGNVQVLFSTRK